MSEKHSEASKLRWKKISPEERSRRMSLVAQIKWARVSKAKKQKYGLMLVEARKKNKKNAPQSD